MKVTQFIMALAGFLVFGFQISAAEQITGTACYRYSDRESIQVARDIALAMAKRDALEGFAVYVESTSTVNNSTLINDIITGITSGLLTNLKIVEKTENRNENKVCMTISADIEPQKVKETVLQKKLIFKVNFEKQKLPSGLYENDIYKVIKSKTYDCSPESSTKSYMPYFDFDIGRISHDKCYYWRVYCKKRGRTSKPKYIYRWIDKESIPLGTTRWSQDLVCSEEGQIKTKIIPLPPESPPRGIKYSLKIEN